MLCDLVEVEAGPGASPKSLKCFYIVFTFHKQDCPWLLLPCSSCAPKMEFSLGINIDYLSPCSISFCSSSLPHLSLLCICTMDASSLGPFACITVQRKSIHIIQQEQIHFRKHKTLIFSPLHCTCRHTLCSPAHLFQIQSYDSVFSPSFHGMCETHTEEFVIVFLQLGARQMSEMHKW